MNTEKEQMEKFSQRKEAQTLEMQQNNICQTVSEKERAHFNHSEELTSSTQNERADVQQSNIKRLHEEGDNGKRKKIISQEVLNKSTAQTPTLNKTTKPDQETISMEKDNEESPQQFLKQIDQAITINQKANVLRTAKTADQVKTYWKTNTEKSSEKTSVLTNIIRSNQVPDAIMKFLKETPGAFLQIINAAKNIADKVVLLGLQQKPEIFVQVVNTSAAIADKIILLNSAKTGAQVKAYWDHGTENISEKTEVLKCTLMCSLPNGPYGVAEFLEERRTAFLLVINAAETIADTVELLGNVRSATQISDYFHYGIGTTSKKAAVLAKLIKSVRVPASVKSFWEESLDTAPTRYSRLPDTVIEFVKKDSKTSLIKSGPDLDAVIKLWEKYPDLLLVKDLRFPNVVIKFVKETSESLVIRSKRILGAITKFVQNNPKAFLQMTLATNSIDDKIELLGLQQNPEIFVQVINASKKPDEKVILLRNAKSADLVNAYWTTASGRVSEKVEILRNTLLCNLSDRPDGVAKFLECNLCVFVQVINATNPIDDKAKLLENMKNLDLATTYVLSGAGNDSEKADVLAELIYSDDVPDFIIRSWQEKLSTPIPIITVKNTSDLIYHDPIIQMVDPVRTLQQKANSENASVLDYNDPVDNLTDYMLQQELDHEDVAAMPYNDPEASLNELMNILELLNTDDTIYDPMNDKFQWDITKLNDEDL